MDPVTRLRWIAWYAWRDSLAAVRSFGRESVAQGAGALLRQYGVVLRLALFDTIPPWAMYAYRLLPPERRHMLWTYVFDHEVQAYHRWRSAPLGDTGAALVLLQDKATWARQAAEIGLPVADSVHVVPRGGNADFAGWLELHPRLFCKTRHGARGEGAFVVERSDEPGGYWLREFCGAAVTAAAVDDFVRRRLAADDYLIQPCLVNHESLAGLGEPDLAITLRIITRRQDDDAIVASAFLEVPVALPNGEIVFLFLPANLTDGTLSAATQTCFSELRAAQIHLHAALGSRRLPYWGTVCHSARTAHRRLVAKLYSVAWDFVLTPDGARLLEGNSGWEPYPVQSLDGGLLASPPPKLPTTVNAA